MKLGIGQLNIEWESIEINKEKCLLFMEDAKNQGVDLLIFPEMTLTGFSMNVECIGDQNGDTLRWFSDMAIFYGFAIGFGYVVVDQGLATNRFCIVTPDGNTLSNYDKIHPFSYGGEDQYYKGGNEVVQFELGGYTFSTFICYDLRFPELFQVASKKADAILLIANWPSTRSEHWKALLKARAIENQCWFVGVNRYGEGNGLSYSGDSMVIDPQGKVQLECQPQEMLGVVTIDLNHTAETREKFRFKQDRQPLKYSRDLIFQSESLYLKKALLIDKNIVVTGACGLLGRQMINCLAEFGANVIVADIDEIKGKAIAQQLMKQFGVKARFHYVDITSDESVERFTDEVLETWGDIYGLVNNAYPRNKQYGAKFEDISTDSWADNVNMHLNGYFRITQRIAEIMKKQRKGCIINMSSIYGILGPDFSVYEGTTMTMPAEYSVIKGGLLNFSKYLATYYAADGLRVNTVSPGGIFDNQPISFVERYSAKTPMLRMGLSHEIPGAVVFLLSDLASFITGQNIVVDGGWSAW